MLEAIFIFKESLDPARLAAFILIWAGLCIYSVSLFQTQRRSRRPSA
jgi:chloramphenicol-sensitive protein RarD